MLFAAAAERVGFLQHHIRMQRGAYAGFLADFTQRCVARCLALLHMALGQAGVAVLLNDHHIVAAGADIGVHNASAGLFRCHGIVPPFVRYFWFRFSRLSTRAIAVCRRWL